MERRKDLDFAKGVGIILMVLGHCYSAGNGEHILCWLYSFHMPLFFLIPGIVYGIYRRHTTDTFWNIVKKKVKRLLIPYFFFATITASFLSVLGRKTLAVFGAYMWRIITLQGINAMWFIPCFLAAELIFVAANRTKYAIACNAVIALAGMIAVCAPVLRGIAPGIQNIIIGAAFLSLGFLCARIYTTSIKFPLWLGCVVLHLVLAILNERVDLAYGVYGTPILYFVNGLLGTFVAIRAFTWLAKSRLGNVSVWLGENSIIVLCTSSVVIEVFRLMDYKLTNSILPSLGGAEGIILCALVMMAEVFMILFCNKYLWFITGKNAQKQTHNVRSL